MTISNRQNFTFSQIRQAKLSISVKIALHFGGKIQTFEISTKNLIFTKNPPLPKGVIPETTRNDEPAIHSDNKTVATHFDLLAEIVP